MFIRIFIFCFALFFSFGIFAFTTQDKNNHLINIRIFKLIDLKELNISSKSMFNIVINNGKKNIKTLDKKSFSLVKLYSNYIRITSNRKLVYKGKWKSIVIKENSTPFMIGNRRIHQRPYSGSIKLEFSENPLTHRIQWFCINRVDIDTYIKSVVQSEMGRLSQSAEALKSQTIVSRSFSQQPRHLNEGYDFCDTTHCQVYLGDRNISYRVKQAIQKTKGQYLLYHGKVVRAYYHSTCGGKTTSPSNVWPQSKENYIEGVYDSDRHGNIYCKNSPHFKWQAIIKKSKLASMFLSGSNEDSYLELSNIIYDSSGRIQSMFIRNKSDWVQVSGESFRITVGRNIGWNNVKSSCFELSPADNESLLIEGYGLGHGVGLCQYGAIKLAELGRSYKEILKHYFPKCEVKTSD